MTRRIAPSILAADPGRLVELVAEVVDAGADVIHVDIMDGHFVPPLSMGPQVVDALRSRFADLTLDVHLMVKAPERHVPAFASAGASIITFHDEATPHADYVVNQIREAGCRAGIAVCPSTPPAVFGEVRPDIALVMTVNPGWGGQKFIAAQVDKVRRVRALLGDDVEVEVDGGIDAETAPACAGAGATLFVAGSAVFGAADPAGAYRTLCAAAGCG
jgi:ribulose-phosphate 3-epimerase